MHLHELYLCKLQLLIREVRNTLRPIAVWGFYVYVNFSLCRPVVELSEQMC